MDPQEDVSPLRELLGRGEEVINVFLEELTGSSNLREELEKTVDRATRARRTVDRNMESLLGALNLPTRSDYKKLVQEFHALQGSIVNLNMKIDRLLAAQGAATFAAGPKPAAFAADVPSAPKAVVLAPRADLAGARPKSRTRATSQVATRRKKKAVAPRKKAVARKKSAAR